MNEPYEPYVGNNMPANQPPDESFDRPRDEERLSTADMAAAAEQRNPDQEGGTKSVAEPTPPTMPPDDGAATITPGDVKKGGACPAALLSADEVERGF
jgi:hypothetical protein